ncbi:MAG: 2-C-methyl-D-erythritol 2,4-cyclodiphosphate synthase [Deltaproteobacteria bacterium]|nr:2-C-methyl-D-erythritol 2,4-cyclodiphosphate synthase [Deltaproteobacteria bacterium]
MRIGFGYDIHRLVPGRDLVLGGVHIPYDLGLDGHSDADALVHALCDALFGAAGMGDIGQHFPDTDPAFKGIYSIDLLCLTWKTVSERFAAIGNIDATILAQTPKMAPHIPAMVEKIAASLGIGAEFVNIKATTTEGLGNIGENKAIAAMCVVLIE